MDTFSVILYCFLIYMFHPFHFLLLGVYLLALVDYAMTWHSEFDIGNKSRHNFDKYGVMKNSARGT